MYLTQFKKAGADEDDFHIITLDIDERLLVDTDELDYLVLQALHCNGIICLVRSMFVALYNPSLAKFKSDSTGDNYKLVRILPNIYDYDNVKAEVYNFGTDYHWREIKIPLKASFLHVDSPAYCKGA
ncbi:hypothetical protein TorRG33x02_007660 [Trema orientale]|uniref:Uncharacterized protein n=1 Tax=Trema orientale TaxID=63057 RepID=A0A2P5G0L1_TREOI|nr:hypothetical protein TorRG33x02_007660 [Trema orientale]